ncbi:PQQ-dependent sugar dehydrogenase [Cytobacillus sp. FSL W7-1323]|nr:MULTISPECIES: PQQ-dependent sugar dehydrogenase [Cytobacillus]MEA1853833.1 PQQ-dependent sugar dehydrogenase [Cytobacillus sp. OWB-43]
MKKLTILFVASFLLILMGCNSNNEMDEEPESVDVSNQQKVEVVAEDLDIPWSINKRDDVFYLSERTGTIAKIEGGELTRQPVELEKSLSTAQEAGLLGFVLIDDGTKGIAYYTYELDGQPLNRVVTLSLDDQKQVWVETDLLLDEIPSGAFHHGGRLAIGPDDKLYVTTGDATEPELAQDQNSLAGKILRMNKDGSIPEDNPSKESYLYSYGHRNPQGLAWTDEGEMYASEHGPTANDEINKITAHGNYGWPEITGTEEKEGMITPLVTSGDDTTWAPSGIAYADNNLYIASLRGTAVMQLNLETNEMSTLVSDVGRVRDVYVDGDHLYFISNNTDGRGNPAEQDDRLYRLKIR